MSNYPITTIQTKRLYLRAACKSDISGLHEMFQNPDVMRYWSSPPHTSISQTRDWLSSMLTAPTNGTLDFIIVLSSSPSSPITGPVIGKIGLFSPEKSEVGYMLNRAHWGQGYMSEAFVALLPHLWANGVERVTADVDPRNESSLGLLGKFGFRETGRAERTIEVGGVWVDSVFLELERPGA